MKRENGSVKVYAKNGKIRNLENKCFPKLPTENDHRLVKQYSIKIIGKKISEAMKAKLQDEEYRRKI
jgi:hypothetical protein